MHQHFAELFFGHTYALDHGKFPFAGYDSRDHGIDEVQYTYQSDNHTDSVTHDSRGTSLTLLFHYFTNKKGLYLYLWNNAIQQIRRSTQKYKVTDTDEFFEMIRRALLAKCHVIRTSAYLYNFCVKAYYETEQEILSSIQSSFQAENAHSEDVILKTVNWSTFRGDIDTHLLYQQIIWMADGYLRQAVLSKKCDAGLIEQDFLRMIEQWKRVYLK